MTPKTSPFVVVPDPERAFLAVFKSLTSVQLVTFQVSTFATTPGAALPPAPNAAVCVPKPAKSVLAVFKSFISVQDDPFQDSVTANLPGGKVTGVKPPKLNAEVLSTPAFPVLPCLAVFKSATSVQFDPFQVSVFAIVVVEVRPP